MSPAVWPSDLPRPNRAGYQAQLQDPRLSRSREQGPPGYRRRWSSVARPVSMVIDVTRSQKAQFDAFVEQTTQMAVLPFWMPDPTTEGWLLLNESGQPILTEAGVPVLLGAQWLCLFGAQMPVETIKGNRFLISFSVTVMP